MPDTSAPVWENVPAEPIGPDSSTDDLPSVADGEFVWTTELPGGAAGARSVGGDVRAAQVWAACGVFTDNHKLVRAFSRKAMHTTAGAPGYVGAGTSNLKCGSEKWGYRHLLKHRGEWEKNAKIEGKNWRDLADFAIAVVLSDPDVVSYRRSNDTYCFSREIYLIDKRTGRVAATKKPKVAIAAVSKNIITAYIPNTGCKADGS
ncbi:hypothetical protein Sya03_33280 [Spirilliplanes yamanashiensis]|uniref:Uncharacterized protein n=1 Tax=Spirilliplanes yamanashiensis TaxID=42233 RepID=A0A8J3Y8J3_9ACTN|nr:hypothetical protein Sya03_33280 [Spirilliplanes yamanashiensis]